MNLARSIKLGRYSGKMPILISRLIEAKKEYEKLK